MSTVRTGQCHCGGVIFEVTLQDGFDNIRRCNCSLCRRKGAVMASVPLAGLKVVKGQELLTLYQWNTKTAQHFFCKVCGIYTHHRRRSVPTEYGFNVACIDGVDPYAFADIRIVNGAGQSVARER